MFFTLNKGAADPRYFNGVPSTVGAIMAVTSVILFREQAALVGLFVGIACAQMVAFRTHYRHLGRALAGRELPRRAASAFCGLLVLGWLAWGGLGSVAAILAASLSYGFLPSALAFAAALEQRREGRSC